MKSEPPPPDLEVVASLLRRVPGIVNARVVHPKPGDDVAPFATIQVSTETGGKWTYRAEVMGRLSKNTLPTAIDHIRSTGRETPPFPKLLVADYLTQDMAEVLEHEGIEFIDLAGNVYLRFPNFFILIAGRPRPPKAPGKAFTQNGLRVVYGLLVIPDVQSLTYRDISAFTGVSLATVSRTIASLEHQGYVTTADSWGVRVLDFLRLLQRWEIGYQEMLRTRLGPSTWFVAAGDVKDALELLEDWRNIFVGGDAAASLLMGSELPQDLTLHADQEMHARLGPYLSLAPIEEVLYVDKPDLYLFETLTPFDMYEAVESLFPVSLAHPILIHAELLARGGDQRRETATRLLHDLILPSYEKGTL